MSEANENASVFPGIHEYAEQNMNRFFSSEEVEIAHIFGRYWYLTKADQITIGASTYRYFLIKAPANLFNQFNIAEEIIVILSEFEIFEPRTFDAFDMVKNNLESGRVENLCGVLVSKDNKIDISVNQYNNSGETRTIIPFSYSEILSGKNDSYLFRNKFQRCFYDRDLFGYDDVLKTDLYFFGRTQLVNRIIDKHLSAQNSGLFGLRKTGKTSIIFDVKRKIAHKNAVGVFINCQESEMSNGNWIDSIYYIVKCIYEEVGWDVKTIEREHFTEVNASGILEEAIKKVYDETGKSILLLFDEVEHITYKKAAATQWGEGKESVFFWKAIRSAFQKEGTKFTYCIVGTNPKCIEYDVIQNAENPIFNGVSEDYIPGFDIDQTRSMVRKLGRIMGIKFDECLYSKMTEDYGGHPFLIRRLCSYISQQYVERPVFIDRIKYNNCKQEFDRNQGKYFKMILKVLEEFYNDEYDMLTYLASDEIEDFKALARLDSSLTRHLIGYGIISEVDGEYDFKMDVIKQYLILQKALHKANASKEEKWAELCARRGNFEIRTRKMVKNVLKIGLKALGDDPKEYVMKKLYNDKDKRRKYATYSFSDLFDPNKAEIYLKSLAILINAKWDLFADYMNGITQEDFIHCMDVLNVEGRFDAHGKIPSDDDMVIWRGCISKLEKVLDNYEDS